MRGSRNRMDADHLLRADVETATLTRRDDVGLEAGWYRVRLRPLVDAVHRHRFADHGFKISSKSRAARPPVDEVFDASVFHASQHNGRFFHFARWKFLQSAFLPSRRKMHA